MKCTRPRVAYHDKETNSVKIHYTKHFHDSKTGLDPYLVHNSATNYSFPLPCGKCLSCRLDQSAEKAVRFKNEFDNSPNGGMFLTLTYDDEHLPFNYEQAFSYFNKHHFRDCVDGIRDSIRNGLGLELRQSIPPENRFKVFGIGEYGDETGRPHFHAIVFNYKFEDLSVATVRDGNPVYHSQFLAQKWPYGLHEIGEVVPETINYVARYAVKKIGAKPLHPAQPPEGIVYRSHGIGQSYLDKYIDDLWNTGKAFDGIREVPLPRYYKKKLLASDPIRYESLKKSFRLGERNESRTKERSSDRETIRNTLDQKTKGKI